MDITYNITGGERLEAQLEEIIRRVKRAARVEAGFLANATYPVTQNDTVMPVAQVAFWNEFGTTRAPPRPFFRNTIQKKSPEWGPALGKFLQGSDYDAEVALGKMGVLMSEQIRDAISSWPPDNAKSTVRRKGFNHGLVDTGVMMRSVDSAVY